MMNELLPIIINAVLALVSLGALIQNRRESKSRVENLDALTKKLEVERKQANEDLADKATDKNNELFDRLQKERDDNERIRREERKEYEDALKRINRDLEDFKTNLKNKESREVILLNDIERYKAMKTNDDVRMGELEQKLANVENMQEKHDVAIHEIARKTGQLPSEMPSRLEK